MTTPSEVGNGGVELVDLDCHSGDARVERIERIESADGFRLPKSPEIAV